MSTLTGMNALQELVANRMAELDMSFRRTAKQSGGLVSAATLNRITRGNLWNIEDSTVKGIALALQIPPARVEEAVAKCRETPSKVRRRLPPNADELSPKGWQVLLRTLDFLLDEQRKNKR